MSDKDFNVRCELAALYRILHMYGMTDLANQCAGARSIENKDKNNYWHINCITKNEYKLFFILRRKK